MQKENMCCYKKRMSCRKFVIRHLRIFVSDEMVNERKEIRRSRIKSGMTPNLMGFTLIELLVVVLIIGILAAVALPQYTLAVDKARLSNLMSVMQTLKNAQEVYYTANGAYATDWETLDIDKPANTDYTLSLISNPQGIHARYNNLKNILLTIVYDKSTSGLRGKWYCYAKKDDNRAKKLCQNISKKKNAEWLADTGIGQAYAYSFTR